MSKSSAPPNTTVDYQEAYVLPLREAKLLGIFHDRRQQVPVNLRF